MSRSDARTIRELRSENTALHRQVARLKKQLRRYQEDPEEDEDDEGEEEPAPVSPPVPEPAGCPGCGSKGEPMKLDTPGGENDPDLQELSASHVGGFAIGTGRGDETMISVYTDGSSSGGSGKPGGWCWIILVDGQPFKMDKGGHPSTTNNRMEMTAALEGLVYLRDEAGLDLQQHIVELVSDSMVTLGLASGQYTPSANVDIAKPLADVAKELRVRTRWVKGHAKEHWNERCDRFAKMEKKKLEDLRKAS